VGPLMREKKHSLRVATLAQRSLLSRSESLARSRLIQARALQFPPYLLRRSVALYNPIQNEVETGEIRDQALVTGKNVFFPRFGLKDSLELIKIESATQFSQGRFGVLEPTGERRLARRGQEELVIFAPGVAFDVRGNRLGRGKGWYDRLIKELEGAIFGRLSLRFSNCRPSAGGRVGSTCSLRDYRKERCRLPFRAGAVESGFISSFIRKGGVGVGSEYLVRNCRITTGRVVRAVDGLAAAQAATHGSRACSERSRPHY